MQDALKNALNACRVAVHSRFMAKTMPPAGAKM